ncbi:NAD(P)-dependent oxidoreductase [Actinoplanes sp. NPDC051475]|uniref:NAD-dependent epimerase/dehydratase family protein n=1 Tax=Actinoplanes sp. NPDC051475 TaxID=3157225 RepID=UPI00344C0B66
MAMTTKLVNRRVLVIGGTGFVGRHVCAALTAVGADVSVLARRMPGSPGPPAQVLDITGTDPQEIARLVRRSRADVVVNCAGAVWQPTPAELEAGNVELVRRLTRGLAGLRPAPLLIQLGSVHEYGAGAGDGPTPETFATGPVTDYGRSKLRGTEVALAASRDGEPAAVVLRAANTTGPGLPRGSLLGGVAGRLADFARGPRPAGAVLELDLPPLTAQRDFVDIRDLADAVVAAAAAPVEAVRGEVLNIGSGRALPVRHLVDRLVALSGLPVRITDRPGGTARRDVDLLLLDTAKAHKLLGWEPRRDLDASLSDMLTTA